MEREGSESARQAAQRLLRWYPKPWRLRYGVEMRELVDEMPVRWRQFGDLAIGAAREWMSPRAFGWPARSAAGRLQVVRGWKFVLAVCGIEAIAHWSRTFFPTDVSAFEPIFERVSIVIMAAGTLRMSLGGVQLLMKRKVWRLTAPETAIWFVAVLVYLVVDHVRPIPSYVGDANAYVFFHHLSVYVWVNLLWMGSSRTKRLQRVYYAHRKRLLQRVTDGQPQVTASPITGWDSSRDDRSSDRFW